jgi:hypothetical protein
MYIDLLQNASASEGEDLEKGFQWRCRYKLSHIGSELAE